MGWSLYFPRQPTTAKDRGATNVECRVDTRTTHFEHKLEGFLVLLVNFQDGRKTKAQLELKEDMLSSRMVRLQNLILEKLAYSPSGLTNDARIVLTNRASLQDTLFLPQRDMRILDILSGGTD